MVSNSLTRYHIQKKEVDDLLDFHSRLRGTQGKGRSAANLEVLHKSAVVLLTACWESYVENILAESIELIARYLNDSSLLNDDLRKSIASTTSKNLRINKNHDLYPWFFTGDGWRIILWEFAELKISELNTPDSANAKTIFALLLGIEDITLSWGRPAKSSPAAAEKLDNHLIDRHVIAHGASPTKNFTKSYITNYRDFLDLTVEKTDKEVSKKLLSVALYFREISTIPEA